MKFNVSAHEESLESEDLLMYAQCVGFMAYWCEKHDGARGKDAREIFDEFRDNVTTAMKTMALEGETDAGRNYGLRPDQSEC